MRARGATSPVALTIISTPLEATKKQVFLKTTGPV
jgi:hypothetical protein